jgi:uncharacterized membrane protein YfcA
MIQEYVAVSLASFAAAFVDSIAGGGGLVSVPILFAVFPTAPPATLFGTNKAAMVWGTGRAAWAYHRRLRLPWRSLAVGVVAALAGGFLGAFLVTVVAADWLRRILPFLLGAVFVFTLLNRDLGRTHAPRHAPAVEAALIVAVSFALGVYDGFFGPGTGSFLIFLFVKLLGYDFLHAVGGAKVINTATNLASLVLFAATGNVWWRFVLPMALANLAGSVLGTRLALRHGTGLIRVVFAIVTGLLIVKTGYDAYVPR